MSETDLARLFVRFRGDGDVAALACIFDRTAPDLLDLARHLSRRQGLAGCEEDLVQATFLTAIERRDSFDASRPLEPWLAGILANHAAHAWRRESRVRVSGNTDENATITERDSARVAIDREVREEVTRALAQLPQHYRSLVEERLLGEERVCEIAARRGRSASVVRSQLHRGLLCLRRALPPGLIGSLVAYAITHGSLRRGRQQVVTHAARSVSALTAKSTSLALGGMLMMSKPIVLGAFALVLLLVGFALLRPDSPSPRTLREPKPENLSPKPAAIVPSSTQSVERTASLGAPEATPVAETKPPAVPESYLRALAGVRGRLLEADGSPTAHTAITLLAWDRGHLTTSLAAARSPDGPFPESGRTTTDAEGRFAFDRIEPAAIHALAVDAGGPRSTLKGIDVPLVSGTMLDLGDIRLGAAAELSGRIVDDAGAPVAGARIRVVPNLPIVLGATIERVTSSTLVLTEHGDSPQIESLPIWMRRLLPHLPLPTARSNEHGAFEVNGAPSGSQVLWVDAAGFVPAMFGPFVLEDGKPRDAGTLELGTGDVLGGTITDAGARPLSGIELAMGTTGPLPDFAFLSERTTTNESGRFAFAHVPQSGTPKIVARPSRASHWRALPIPSGAREDLPWTLPDIGSHELHLRRGDGEPLGTLDVRIAPDTARNARTPFERDDEWETPEFTLDDNGKLSLRALLPGSYRAQLQIEGCGTTTLAFDVAVNSGPQDVLIAVPRSLEFRVVDDETDAPIEHASVVLFSPLDWMLEIAETRSDANGVARLAPVPLEESARVRLRVVHPSFAPMRSDVEIERGEITTIRLAHGGAIEGKFVCDGAPPAEPMLLVLTPSGHGSALALPIFVAANARGEFQARGIPPDRYEWSAHPNLLAGDWRTLSQRVSRDARLLETEPEQRGRIAIESGETARLEVEITPRGSAKNGRIRGRVTSHGAPVRDARLHASTGRDRVQHPVDANGYYELEDVRPGRVVVTLYCGSFETPEGINTLVARTIDLAAGSTATVDFQVAEQGITLRVTDHGAPAAGVEVELQPTAETQESRWFQARKTDLAGEVQLAANEPGIHRVVADDPSRGYLVTEITIPSAQPITALAIDPGITLAGRIEIDPLLGRASDCGSLLAEVVVSGAALHRHVEIDATHATFRIEHLPRGDVVFSLPGGPMNAKPLTVALDTTNENIVLKFAR